MRDNSMNKKTSINKFTFFCLYLLKVFNFVKSLIKTLTKIGKLKKFKNFYNRCNFFNYSVSKKSNTVENMWQNSIYFIIIWLYLETNKYAIFWSISNLIDRSSTNTTKQIKL